MKARPAPALIALLLWGAGDGVRDARADWRVDDDLLAHRLFTEGRHGEAAEIFTDPAWKGVALYRSEQWWRAAEAFVRADDPVSAYNLGNCYVKLGYHALALDAYQRALAGDPTLDDARHNAELMRELLAADDDAAERGGRRDPDDEIDRLEVDEDEAPGGGADGDRDAEGHDGSEGERGAANDDRRPSDATDESERGESGDEELDESGDGETGDAVGGDAGAPEGEARPSGTAETEADGSTPEDAVGLRAALEAEQATEQWLNRIGRDPARYLEKRIRLEMRRRRAAGQAAPAGGDGW